MALFLKMKSINESEIQENTSPCASQEHKQNSETHIYFWQTSASTKEIISRSGYRFIYTSMDGHAYCGNLREYQ